MIRFFLARNTSLIGTLHLIRASFCWRVLALLLLQTALIAGQVIGPSALSVPLLLPSAVVFDPAGNLYIAEAANHVVRRVDPSGHLVTIAGNGVQGFSGDGAIATSATLDSPQGVVLGQSNALYIADTHNHRIRRLDLGSGIITTVAGTGIAGFSGDNGPAVSAQLDRPTSMAVDSTGNIFLADTGNQRIRRMEAASGIITTVAGNGTQGSFGQHLNATQAALDSPTGLAVDPSGNLFVADTHNHRILRIDSVTGVLTTVAGTGTPGFSGDSAAATLANLALPQGITIDSAGNVYFADTENHRIRRIDAVSGIITTVAGSGIQGFSGDGGATVAASLDSPAAATLPPSGLLTFADTNNGRIRQLQSQNIISIAGPGSAVSAVLVLSSTAAITYGSGQLTATLTSAAPASGTVTFFNTAGSSSTPMGVTALASGIATLSLSAFPAGTYTVDSVYSGDATHASTQSAPITFTIAPARTSTTLTDLVATAAFGSSITLTAQAASAAGTPPGTITLLDGNLPVATNTLSRGVTAFSLSGLSSGTHNFIAAYNGAPDFSPSASNPQAVTIGTGPSADFTIAATGTTSITTSPGTSAVFSFAVQTSPALSSPVTLAASGQPPFSTVSFSPSYLPPGSSQGSVNVTFTTPANAQISTTQRMSFPQGQPLFLALLVPVFFLIRRKRTVRLLSLILATFLWTTGCGDRVNSAPETTPLSKSYTITVTGTATSPTGATLTHSAVVTLVLQAAT